jgi:hypothetical protein
VCISYRFRVFIFPYNRIPYLITGHWAMIYLFQDVVLKYGGKFSFLYTLQSRGSSVSIATGYGLDDRGIGARFPAVERYFSLHSAQSGSGAHPTSCTRCIGKFPVYVKKEMLA